MFYLRSSPGSSDLLLLLSTGFSSCLVATAILTPFSLFYSLNKSRGFAASSFQHEDRPQTGSHSLCWHLEGTLTTCTSGLPKHTGLGGKITGDTRLNICLQSGDRGLAGCRHFPKKGRTPALLHTKPELPTQVHPLAWVLLHLTGILFFCPSVSVYMNTISL